MGDENKDLAPEGTTDPTDQPRTDPETPASAGQVKDNQQDGITDDGTQAREAFYQTRYQDVLGKLNSYEQQFGPLQQGGGPEIKQPEPAPEEDGEDAWVNEVAKRSAEMTLKQLRVWVEGEKAKQAKEEQYRAEINYAGQQLQDWATANKVPQDVLDKHIGQVIKELPPDTRPTVIAKYAMRNIIAEAGDSARIAELAKAKKEAAEKGKELSRVKEPEGGAPPEPHAEDKTPSQAMRDRFAEAGRKKAGAFDNL